MLTVHAAKTIYASMVLPTFTYYGLVNLSWNKGEIEKLRRIKYRSNCIVKSSSRNAGLKLTSWTDAIRKGACIVVDKCVSGEYFPDLFDRHFEIVSHAQRI